MRKELAFPLKNNIDTGVCVFNAFILFVLYISQLRKDNVVRKMRMVKTELGKSIQLMNLV